MTTQEEFSTFATAASLIATTAAGQTNLGSVALDMGAAPGDVSQGGCPVYVVVEISTAVDSAGDGALIEFALVSDSAVELSTPTVHLSTGAIPQAQLTAGALAMQVPLPAEGQAYEQYLGVRFTVTGENSTAGAANAYLTMNPPKWVAIADGAPTPA